MTENLCFRSTILFLFFVHIIIIIYYYTGTLTVNNMKKNVLSHSRSDENIIAFVLNGSTVHTNIAYQSLELYPTLIIQER